MDPERLSHRTSPRNVPVQSTRDVQSVFTVARQLVGASRNGKLLRESVYKPHPENDQLRIERSAGLEIHGPYKVTLEQMVIALHSLLTTVLAKQRNESSSKEMWNLDRHILEQLLAGGKIVPTYSPTAAPADDVLIREKFTVEMPPLSPLQRRLAVRVLRMRSFWENITIPLPADKIRWRTDGYATVEWD